MKNENKNIPEQEDGAHTDTQHSKTFDKESEAKAAYEAAKTRLLSISSWHQYAGTGTADLDLTDKNGNLVNRLAEEGDHFRIEIPGPGSETGDGYDWVQIQSISEESDANSQSISIKVRPTSNPQSSNTDVAHFFKEDASSTFVVKRNGLVVSAEVHGRNEKPNTNSENLVDKARNIIVALGAILGFSTIQWKSLVKGIITQETP